MVDRGQDAMEECEWIDGDEGMLKLVNWLAAKKPWKWPRVLSKPHPEMLSC